MAIHFRHVQVEQDDIRASGAMKPLASQKGQRLDSVGGDMQADRAIGFSNASAVRRTSPALSSTSSTSIGVLSMAFI
jgi:hypothetical protein